MHIGTFTKPGTWRSAEDELPHLAETGVTVLEIMPVAEFPGRFGWGYDGVQWFAPTRIYGSPDDFPAPLCGSSAFAAGPGGRSWTWSTIILGPDGNYLEKFAPQFFCEKTTDWGKAINFDGDDCGPVREFCIANACYWIDEFHLDGLRLDATQDIHDSSEDHILQLPWLREARQHAAPRELIFIGENEPQEVKLVKSPREVGAATDWMALACGTTIFITPRWWRSPGATKLTTPIIKARRKSSFQQSNMAISIRDSATSGRRSGAVRQAWT